MADFLCPRGFNYKEVVEVSEKKIIMSKDKNWYQYLIKDLVVGKFSRVPQRSRWRAGLRYRRKRVRTLVGL